MTTIATLARALPDDALLSLANPACVASALRALPDAKLEACFVELAAVCAEPAPTPPSAAEPPPRRKTHSPVEVTTDDMARVGASIDAESGSIKTLAERLGMPDTTVRAAVDKLIEAGLVKRKGVGRATVYESVQPEQATS